MIKFTFMSAVVLSFLTAPVSATKQGDAQEQFDLACKYAIGEGVERNEAMAVDLYRKAANQGHTQAQCNLAFRHANGKGVRKDLGMTLKLYTAAGMAGDTTAKSSLQCLLTLNRDLVGESFTPYALSVERQDVFDMHMCELTLIPRYKCFKSLAKDLSKVEDLILALNRPGFLINCLSVKNHFIESQKNGFIRRVHLDFQGFTCFGEENVKSLALLEYIRTLKHHPEIDKAISWYESLNSKSLKEEVHENLQEMILDLKALQSNVNGIVDEVIEMIVSGAAGRNKNFVDMYGCLFEAWD